MIYRTQSGDVLDAICHSYYGPGTAHVEAVLEANPGLADRGPVLRSGVLVTLPDMPEPKPVDAQAIRLWD